MMDYVLFHFSPSHIESVQDVKCFSCKDFSLPFQPIQGERWEIQLEGKGAGRDEQWEVSKGSKDA